MHNEQIDPTWPIYHNQTRVYFSDLQEHSFDHNFACESPMCMCHSGIESSTQYFLHCRQYSFHRRNLLDKVSDIGGNDITQLPDNHLCDLLLFGSNAYNKKANKMILKWIVEFVKQSTWFGWAFWLLSPLSGWLNSMAVECHDDVQKVCLLYRIWLFIFYIVLSFGVALFFPLKGDGYLCSLLGPVSCWSEG